MRINEQLDADAEPLWAGRPETRERLILHFMLFAEKLASTGARKNPKISQDECLSAAYAALIDSIDRYHSGGATRFTSFATTKINFALIDEARGRDWIPHGARSQANSGQREVPLMLPLSDDFDSVNATERERWEADFDEISKHVALPRHRRIVADLIELGPDEASRLAGCSVEQTVRVARWAMELAQSEYSRQQTA